MVSPVTRTPLKLLRAKLSASERFFPKALSASKVQRHGPLSDGPATRPTPFGFQEPREIGSAVVFFASDWARAITNHALAIDGGFSVS
jgi:enoyl-[acyl-carrier-protein] reductase (NADH)